MTIEEVLALVRPNIRDLKPYSTARDECEGVPEVFLDANESPYDNGMNRYPDPRQRQLKKRIAGIKGIDEASLFLGNGSDEAIDLAYRIFCEPGKDNAVAISPSYGMYSVAAATNDVAYREVRLLPDFSLDVEAMLKAADSRTKLIFICSPNNPSGNSFPASQIEEILAGFGGMVVLDEAYIDYSEQASLVPLIGRYPNLIVLQTLSKAWGMAGLRIGLAVGDPQVISIFGKVKYPYNINVAAQKLALGALDGNSVKARVSETIGQRFRLVKELRGCPEVLRIYPSDANFLLVKVTDPDGLYQRLIEGKVIVRNRSRVPGCEGCLRITVGTPEQNDRLLEIMTGKPAPESGLRRLGERHVSLVRKTRETEIAVELDLDPGVFNERKYVIDTGLGFFDHMLEQIPNHGGVGLGVIAKGDLRVDEHHTIEDTGICLGEALKAALGSKAGIARYGFVLPMDDCDVSVLIDFGGRTDFKWEASFSREKIGDVPTEMFSHFFGSLCSAACCNIHVKAEGENEHHKIEAIFKAFARALSMAVKRGGFPYGVPSSKGKL